VAAPRRPISYALQEKIIKANKGDLRFCVFNCVICLDFRRFSMPVAQSRLKSLITPAGNLVLDGFCCALAWAANVFIQQESLC
jgi:hypothetical protein